MTDEDYVILGCDIVYFGRKTSLFRKNLNVHLKIKSEKECKDSLDEGNKVVARIAGLLIQILRAGWSSK
jgi:hypothetical protein